MPGASADSGQRVQTVRSARIRCADLAAPLQYASMPRTGTTLLELALVIVILGILAAIAVPRITLIADEAAVRHQAHRLVGALDAARGAGIRLGTPAGLTVGTARLTVAASVGGVPTTVWDAPGPTDEGVSVSGAGAPIMFGPAGLAVGASNRTIVLSRGAASRRVVISRLGRITY